MEETTDKALAEAARAELAEEIPGMEAEETEEVREPLTAADIARAVNAGQAPEGMNCAERALWHELRDILVGFRAGDVPPAAATALKEAAFAQYEKDTAELMEGRKWKAWHAQFWQRIEAAARSYTKAPSIETADGLYFAIYQVHRVEHGGGEAATE